jgi:hypothetical protein
MAHRKPKQRSFEPDAAPLRQTQPDSDPGSGGQAGDLQGLSDEQEADSQSVRELLEEGQYFEAAVISGVENAPSADSGPVRTHQVPEDDVPSEYTVHPKDEPRE